MFTGLIESVGKVQSLKRQGNSGQLRIISSLVDGDRGLRDDP